MKACNQPKLIITCSSSSVDSCVHEVGNVIFLKDPNVRIEKTDFKGVLFVYTDIDTNRAYTLVSHREYGFVENIIPINCIIEYPPLESELRSCISQITKTKVVKLKVRARGARGISVELFKKVVSIMRALGVNHDPRSRDCLYIEVFKNKIYIGLGDCFPIFKASIMNR